MYVLYEALVREHMRDRHRDAAHARAGEQLLRLHKWQRRADAARRRAERAVARLATG